MSTLGYQAVAILRRRGHVVTRHGNRPYVDGKLKSWQALLEMAGLAVPKQPAAPPELRQAASVPVKPRPVVQPPGDFIKPPPLARLMAGR